MTVRVDALAPVRPLGWLAPALRTLFSPAAWVMRWWSQRSQLVMSDEWLREFRATERPS